MPTHSYQAVILIVDDIDANIQLLNNILTNQGYATLVAYNGIDALSLLEKNHVDLILLDVLMPDMTGYEVCARIKANEKKNDIPIIFITAKTDNNSAIEGLKLGAVDYIPKPFNHRELVARINTHIDLRFSKEELKKELRERKSAEVMLQITKNRLELALIAGNLSWWDWDLKHNTINFNRLHDNNHPSLPQTVTLNEYLSFIHTDFSEIVLSDLVNFANGYTKSYDIEYQILNSRNEWRWVHDKGQIVSFDSLRKPLRIVGVMNDITERKNIQHNLEMSEFKFRTIANYTYDWELWIGANKEVVYMSPACERISGYSFDEFIRNEHLLEKIAHPADNKKLKKILKKAFKGEIIHDFDYRIVHKNKTIKWVSLVSQPITDKRGVFQGIRASLRDITLRKRAQDVVHDKKQKLSDANLELKRYNEQLNTMLSKMQIIHAELEKSRNLYRTLVSNLPDTDVYVFDTDLNLIIIEGHEMRKYGFNSDSYEGRKFTEIVDPQFKFYFDAIFRAALNGTIISQEFSFEGNWYYHQALPLMENGVITGGLFVMRNISEQKKANKALMESEAKYRRVIENAPDGIINLNFYGEMVDINKQFSLMTKFSREELINTNFRDLLPKEEQIAFDAMLKSVINGKLKVSEFNLRTKKKQIIPVEVNSKVIVEKNEIQGFVRDITERKKAEQLLKLSEEKFSKVFHMSPESIIILSAETGEILDLNKSAVKTMGFTKEHYLGKTDIEIDVWKNLNDREMMFSYIKNNGEIYGYESKLKRQGKNEFYGLISGRLVDFRNELCIITTIQDITEKKEAEEIILAERQRFLNLLEKFPSFVCVINADFKIKYANSKFKSLFGEPYNHFCYQKMRKLECKCQPCMLDIVLKTKKDATAEWTDDNGRTYLVQASYFSDIDSSPQLLEVGLDITERKIAEEGVKKALEKAKQLSELKSRFISTVSHEFRTPMTLIKSNTQMLDRFESRLDPVARKKSYQRIYDAVESINLMLSNTSYIDNEEHKMLSYSPSEFDFEDFCSKIADDLNSIAENQIEIVKNFKNPAGIVLMDKSLLRHVLNNVLTNAQKFSYKNSTIDFTINCNKAENMVVLTITDKGIGIDASDLQYIFDPFHRGKNTEAIRGTGLGMAIVKRSLDVMHGTVSVKSKLNEGTTVRIEILLKNKT